jgi:DNA-binding response OmpR family regulator
MKALVIDSSELMRTLLRGILFRRGFEVMEAATPREATRHWGDVAVVLIEWDLRNLELPAFISGARRTWGARALFVALAGSEPESKEVLRAKLSGADHILVKPFTTAQLDAALLDGLVGFRAAQVPLDSSEYVLSCLTEETPIIVHAVR